MCCSSSTDSLHRDVSTTRHRKRLKHLFSSCPVSVPRTPQSNRCVSFSSVAQEETQLPSLAHVADHLRVTTTRNASPPAYHNSSTQIIRQNSFQRPILSGSVKTHRRRFVPHFVAASARTAVRSSNGVDGSFGALATLICFKPGKSVTFRTHMLSAPYNRKHR